MHFLCRMFTYPFPPAIGGIQVTNEDYSCLNDGKLLNDNVISFYLKYLTEQVNQSHVSQSGMLTLDLSSHSSEIPNDA